LTCGVLGAVLSNGFGLGGGTTSFVAGGADCFSAREHDIANSGRRSASQKWRAIAIKMACGVRTSGLVSHLQMGSGLQFSLSPNGVEKVKTEDLTP